jgi:hypothetical protein
MTRRLRKRALPADPAGSRLAELKDLPLRVVLEELAAWWKAAKGAADPVDREDAAERAVELAKIALPHCAPRPQPTDGPATLDLSHLTVEQLERILAGDERPSAAHAAGRG